MGNIACHVYHELELTHFDAERFNLALRRLIERHHMLRMVVLPDGRQKILKEVPAYEVEIRDLSGLDPAEGASVLEELRQRMSHQVMPLDRWPLFEIRGSRLADGRIRVHFGFDTMMADAWSFRVLSIELSRLYQNPEAPLPPLEISFRDYVLADIALRDSELYRRALGYWQGRLTSLAPAPELPLAKEPSALSQPRFERRRGGMDAAEWSQLKARAAASGLTPTGLLLAAYADVLSVWSKSARFSLNVPRFNRLPLHPQVNELIGEFASFTLVEFDGSGKESFETRARRVQGQLWKDLQHSLVSGVRVLRELARAQGEAPRMAMPAVFTSTLGLNMFSEDVTAQPLMGEIVYSITQTPQVWLDHQVFEIDGALVYNWDTVEELFPVGMMDDMFGAYRALLARLASDHDAWLRDPRPDLLPPAHLLARQRVNDTHTPPAAADSELTLGHLVSRAAARFPARTALASTRRSLTYAELMSRAHRLARRLRASPGVGTGRLVAVVMEKGWEQVVAVLGVLGAGAAYLPIEAEVPAERLAYLLRNGEAAVAVTQGWLADKLEWPEGVEVVVAGEGGADEGGSGGDVPAEGAGAEWGEAGADELAYVIYTSGSTGEPKGVMVSHRGAVNAITFTNERFGVTENDRAFALTALHHDMSVYDIFGVLAAGGTMVIPDAPMRRDPEAWVELMRREGVTVWNSVPALLEMLVEHAETRGQSLPDSLRLVFLGGDWIPLTLPRRLRALAKNAQLVSVGGPTETTLWNIFYPVEEVDPSWKSIPYGQPVPNNQYHVLNESLDDRPVWATGQLYCTGVGVAAGYWRDEEKTRAKFITHPRTGQRMYATGDLGRYLPDGNIEFMGREDFQVKISGQRIELGEIESRLGEHPAVRAVALTAVGDARGEKRLVAYIVPHASRPSPTAEELREFLNERLPRHMIPSEFLTLAELPLTSTGKLDRKALQLRPARAAAVATRVGKQSGQTLSPVAARIADIVSAVLEVEEIEPGADLVELGANSLHVARIANQLETTFGFRPAINQLFNLSNVAALAEYYERELLSNQSQIEVGEQDAPRAAGASAPAYRLILRPEEREEFKRQQHGVRADLDDKPLVQLPSPGADDEQRARYLARRSHRKFSLQPITDAEFGRFLGCLRQIHQDGRPKYLYASGGGLYPVQIYLHVKSGRVKGVDAGTYYYHPIKHQLVSLTPGAALDRSIHYPMNRSSFDEAAFSIFLVASLDAIGPIYGEKARDYCLIEAGLLASLLESSAREGELGLCQLGSLNFDAIRSLFALGDNHIFLHGLIGGQRERSAGEEAGEARAVTFETSSEARVDRMMERIKQLSAGEVKELLRTKRSKEDGQ